MTDESIESRALRWSLSDNVGSSSLAIARNMLGMDQGTFGADYPADGGDLRRCVALLDAVPEWRVRLPEMGMHSRAWASLVENWSELEKAARAHHSKLYDRMRDILR